MALDSMLITAGVFGLGAVIRAAIGYHIKVKEDPKVDWDWLTFAVTTLPAFAVGFAAGSVVTNVPELLSTAWFTFVLTSFFGGVGFGSLQSNTGKLFKGKK